MTAGQRLVELPGHRHPLRDAGRAFATRVMANRGTAYEMVGMKNGCTIATT